MFLFGLNFLDDNFVSLVVYFKGGIVHIFISIQQPGMCTYYVSDIDLRAVN